MQHHPERVFELERLLTSIDGPATIVPDPDPDSPKRSSWRTYRRCLESIETDFAVILQDDTVCCPRFAEAARAANLARPGRLISFFARQIPPRNAARMHWAAKHAEPFFEMQRWKWAPTVALGWPRELAVEFLEWIDTKKKIRPDWITDDPLVGEWSTVTERGVLATAPSLVEHPDDTLTIVGSPRGNGSGARRAWCYIGDEAVEKWLALL